ncbi:peptidoglycan editing factor PgeF [Alkalihalobacillus sp. AL-G]|uniref:peptidoglycan editing factor PgeF n=1 Tax=Alkalihalobacillus sp. AL-G TaxID=2926399 RepID=UPI00272C7064|nr:peptidoglycan editing factor PgeF [Alkalihalobacillus sp. AL-G]WLD95078.1 peptidoglycan editing factor PgeF [Alkalihalobacillus sp. AL-G]
MKELFVRASEYHFKISPFTSNNSGTSTAAGISTRHGGVSSSPYHALNLGLHVGDCTEDVVENRHRLAKEVGIPLSRWVFGEQVHAATIHKVTARDCGKGSKSCETGIMGVDGFYTRESKLVLAAAFADCVPLFFSTKQTSLIGIAHAGWKGTVSQIGSKMVNMWVVDEKMRVEDIEVVIGPSIQACCYEVDDRVISKVNEVLHPGDPLPYTINQNGTYQLNLQQLNKLILIKAGVLSEKIQVSSRCTSCQVDNFFSHRKENGKTGRMLAFIANHKGEGDVTI